jgi:hypothetical protein
VWNKLSAVIHHVKYPVGPSSAYMQVRPDRLKLSFKAYSICGRIRLTMAALKRGASWQGGRRQGPSSNIVATNTPKVFTSSTFDSSEYTLATDAFLA